MALSSNRILSIYKSRNTIIEHLRNLDYDVSDYEQFSINEIDAMNTNQQLDMMVERASDKNKIYVKYYLNIKQLRKENLEQLIEDLYDIETILEKKDTLMIVTNEEPNDTIITRIKYLYDHSGIFIVVHYIKRLQFNLLNHTLVPPSIILTPKEVEQLKIQYNLKSLENLPEISRFDPQALALCLRPGQVIKINRKSDTALDYKYYRVCV
jgi:DNA-directed RNA polymerase subunit H (RpoH/RPB5)